MKLSPKTLALFIPLGLAFMVLAFLIPDLKHPNIHRETCEWVGRGKEVQAFKETAHLLYKSSGKEQNDIGLTCQTMGNVLVNEDIPLPFRPGQKIHLTTKDYTYLPTRYFLSVPVINPSEAETGAIKQESSKM